MKSRKLPTDTRLRVNSFFAGIGGFDLGFERSGFRVTFACENNSFCQGVLRKHWPNVPIVGDVKSILANELPDAEVWVAGFPCQDLSLARTPHGARRGLAGARSGLFYDFLKLVTARKPEVVILENVVGLLSSHNGADFRQLLDSLMTQGYAIAWRVLNARYFGVPQSRPRVFICAWRSSPERAAGVLFENGISARPGNERQGFVEVSQCDLTGISVPSTSFCISATSGRHTGLDWARSYVTYPDAVRRLTPTECERLQGFPDKWTVPEDKVASSIRGLETQRYHAIGNAVCVPVIEWIAARISSMHGNSQVSSARDVDRRISRIVEQSFADVPATLDITGEDQKPWKSGGVAYKGRVITSAVSPSPLRPMAGSFLDLVEKTGVDERYFLSINAMQGILRRVDKLGRKLFRPLDEVLRRQVGGSGRASVARSASLSTAVAVSP